VNDWRGALEGAGVLAFQAEDVEVSEIRGFSLSERLFPVVVVTIKDAVVGRIFTMLHEATHLMLREGGLCDLIEETSRAQERIEAFCNHVAGATLMPRACVLEADVVLQHKGTQWADEEIALLAGLSREPGGGGPSSPRAGEDHRGLLSEEARQFQAEFEAQQEEAQQRKALGLEGEGFAPRIAWR